MPYTNRPLPSGRDELITELYVAGTPVREIATRAGVCVKTVRNVARRRGLPSRRAPRPDRDALIVDAYRSGVAVRDIARQHGLSPASVRRIAARAGLPPRSGWQRRYPINEGAFDKPDAVGWWLIGLLAADGSINETENRVSLCQTTDDADVLHAFYAYVGCPDRPLTLLNVSPEAAARQYSRRPAAEARIFSARIVRALARHGVVPRKAGSMRLGPEACSKPAVWLGVLDGDGHVGIYRNGTAPRLAFSGARPLIRQCEEFWRGALDASSRFPRARLHRATTWIFVLDGQKAAAASRTLLAASPVSMRRKRALLAQIAGRTRDGPLFSRERRAIVKEERRSCQWPQRT